MKHFLVYFFILITTSTKAQLTFIGNDVIQTKYDGYTSGKQTQGLVFLGDKYYFISPNGNFYATDGTQENSKILKQFSPQSVAYLKATKKYIYFAYGNGSGFMQDLARYSPATGINIVRNPTKNNVMLELNSQVVPRNNFLVDEVFANYDKEALLIRKYTNDNFYIYIINDKNDNEKVDLVYTQKLNNNYITTPIGVNTELETYKTEVYNNGRQKPTGVYETTITVNKRTETDDTKYEFKTNFSLLKNGMFPFERFLRTKDKIYTLFKIVDSATSKKSYRLFNYENNSIYGTKTEMVLPNDDVDTQLLDGEIYISCKGYLLKYNEAKETYNIIIGEKDATQEWQNIAKNTRFLKVGNSYMYRRGNELGIYNSTSKKTINLTNTTNIPTPPNYYGQHTTLAYAGKNSFYYSQVVENKIVFTRYNTTTNTTSQIEFPEFKKEKFVQIKAILNGENKFVFLASYKGKKDKLIYKMFMYNEDGEPAIENKATTTQPEIQPTPQTEEFDATKFDTKLFISEISKVLKDQSNKFADIKGEPIPHTFKNKYVTTLPLTRFAESFIFDFSKESNLWRFQAESFSLKGKTEALKFFNILDIEMQNLLVGNNIKRIVDTDFKTRKVVNYKFTGVDEINVISLDLSTNASVENFEDAYYTVTIRADKRTK
jgi:hypothetical protein